jgi:hypothetical protein
MLLLMNAAGLLRPVVVFGLLVASCNVLAAVLAGSTESFIFVFTICICDSYKNTRVFIRHQNTAGLLLLRASGTLAAVKDYVNSLGARLGEVRRIRKSTEEFGRGSDRTGLGFSLLAVPSTTCCPDI